MLKLKMVKGVHYAYSNKFVATNVSPFVEVDERDAEYLVSTGYFEIIEEPKAETVEEKPKRKRTTKK